MVLGPSGSGKSSLARAGIVPCLRREPERWHIVGPFRPGREPSSELAARLRAAFHERSRAGIEAPLAREGLAALARALAGHRSPDAEVLIVIDQFEELLGKDAPPDLRSS